VRWLDRDSDAPAAVILANDEVPPSAPLPIACYVILVVKNLVDLTHRQAMICEFVLILIVILKSVDTRH